MSALPSNPAPTPTPPPPPRLILASQSPRRTALLAKHGVRHEVMAPKLEDSELQSGHVHPATWAAALAYVKAAAVVRHLCEFMHDRRGVTVLGADTIVLHGGAIFGKPANADEARAMLRRLRDGAHEVVTGVALVDAHSCERHLLTDTAHVKVGAIADPDIETYVQSGRWQGKAGGYNLDEQVSAGWPIEYEGDPATVMGLPIKKLLPLLEMFRIESF